MYFQILLIFNIFKVSWQWSFTFPKSAGYLNFQTQLIVYISKVYCWLLFAKIHTVRYIICLNGAEGQQKRSFRIALARSCLKTLGNNYHFFLVYIQNFLLHTNLSNVRHYFLVSECLEPSKVAATRTKKEAKGPLPHSWAKVCSSRLRATYTHLCLYAIFELGCTISLWPKLPNFVQKWSCLRNFEVYIGHCAMVRGAARRRARPQNVQAVHLSVQFFFRLLLRSVWSGLQIWSGWLVLIPWLIL